MALHAALVGLDRPRDEQLPSHRRVALANGLVLVRMTAQVFNDLGLPVGGAVLQVRGVQSRFVVSVGGILIAQLVEGPGGAERRHRLGDEAHAVLRRLLQQRRKVILGVVAHGLGAGHHQLRFFQHLAPGVADQEAVRKVCDEQSACSKDHQQDDVKLRQELQGCTPICMQRYRLQV